MTLPDLTPAPSLGEVAPPWIVDVRSGDVDEIAHRQRDWRLEYCQLSAGRYDARLRHVQLPGVRLVSESTTCALRQRGQLGERTVGLAIASSPAGASYFHGIAAHDETIMIGGGGDIDLTLAEDSTHVGIVVEASLLSQLWQSLYLRPWSTWLDERVCVQARPGLARSLIDGQLRGMQQLADDPGVLADAARVRRLRDAVLLEWIEAIPARVELGDLRSLQARRRIVERVCELAAPGSQPPPTLLEVCRQLGLSPRKLEYCFRDVLGISPRKYLRAVRLNQVRRELRQGRGEATIADVAARWGFWHMSDFAADYRHLFGELPSETGRRTRGPGSAAQPLRLPA